MKNMMKILGLVGLLTLASCGSGETNKWVSDCASDQVSGLECEAPPTSPVEPPTGPTLDLSTVQTIAAHGTFINAEVNVSEEEFKFTSLLISRDVDFDTWYDELGFTLKPDGTGTLEIRTRVYWSGDWTILSTEELTWKLLENGEIRLGDVNGKLTYKKLAPNFMMSEVTSVEWLDQTVTFKQSGVSNGNNYEQFEIGSGETLVRLTFIENEGVWVKEGNATGVLKSFEISGDTLLINNVQTNFSL